MSDKATENLTIRVDPTVKRKAEAAFSRKGISLEGAINAFLRRSYARRKRRAVNVPNAETIAVLEEPRSAKVGPFATFEEFLADLKD
jgi:antitoxin component of RelBE/YafQ-DinJ toxin-antitoxin module